MERRVFLRSAIGTAASLWRAKWAAIPAFAAGETAIAEAPPQFQIKAKGIGVDLSAAGEIVGMKAGGRTISLVGRTSLAGCTQTGDTKAEKRPDGAVQFTRTFKHSVSGRSLTAVDRFSSAGDSVRWEIDIVSDGSPWTTEIATELQYPATAATRFWTAWADPVWSCSHEDAPEQTQPTGVWRDPLVLQPMIDATWNYGGYNSTPDHIVLPLATVAEPADDSALSLVFSPADIILCGSRLVTTPAGSVKYSRANYRLGGGKSVHFGMDLVAHEADWRGGLRWMTARYSEFFEPPSPKADAMAGCPAYSGYEGPIDVAKYKKMAFSVNWKLDDDMPYMGMFIPPVASSEETWERSWAYEWDDPNKSHWTSAGKMNDYASYMKTNGFNVLDYFNVFNYGGSKHKAKDPGAPLWQNASAYLAANFPKARLASNREIVDCGDPDYEKFLLDQVDRDIRWLPDSAGVCIDNTYFMFWNNNGADDGVSWAQGEASRALCISWNSFFDQAGPKMRAAGKVIFASPIFSRFDVYRQIDGFYDEYGYDGRGLNSTALMGVRKPVMVWTYNESLFRTDPDSFFQRHLFMGAYPTAPYPWNNHCILPDMNWENPGADLAQEDHDGTRGFYYQYGSLFERDTGHLWMKPEKYYLAYGPLMEAMRGKKWVLAPHCVEVIGGSAKANLFQVPGGYAMPVCFGGEADFVEVALRNIPGLDNFKYSVIHPDVETASAATILSKTKEDGLKLRVPLSHGCAMVTLLA
jgi:hypothetical protein